MRIFVTGSTGFIGSAVVDELIKAGHQVVGLTRSNEGAMMLEKAGAMVQMSDLNDLDNLLSCASNSDGVIHIAFNGKNFSDFTNALRIDLNAIQTMGAALDGTGKPFVITNHMNGETSINALFALKGVRASVVSLAPTVHGVGEHGFVPRIIDMARTKGFCAYVGDGANRWPAVHRLDAATLFRLALEKAPACSRLSGRAEEGIPFRDIMTVIGKNLNLPVVSITPEEADSYFEYLSPMASRDFTSMDEGVSIQTKKLLGWVPVHPTLIEDIESGHYFKS